MNSEQALARVIERLEEDRVAYMVVGAMSSNLYGVPRATDLLTQLRGEAAG